MDDPCDNPVEHHACEVSMHQQTEIIADYDQVMPILSSVFIPESMLKLASAPVACENMDQLKRQHF